MKRSLWSTVVLVVIASLTVAIEPAFAATTYSFTTAGASGNTGPTQTQINTAYSGTNLAGQVTINTQGIQEWTVPSTGEYYIEIAGASGGFTPNAIGGKGRVIKIRVSLTGGNLLKILVGQEGGKLYFATGYAGGGGGGTYIYDSSASSYLAVAGGGGGAAQGNTSYVSTQNGVDASVYTSSSGTAGTSYAGSWEAAKAGGASGNGGQAGNGGSGGAGVTTNGATSSFAGGTGGVRFSAGGAGGSNKISGSSPTYTTNELGGFGGGAGAGIYTTYDMVGGGGGGYSGGGGGGTRVGAGGGGGNYFTGTFVSSSLNTGHGYVTIQSAVSATVSLAISGSPTKLYKGEVVTLSATLDDVVRITFYADGKKIPGCISKSASSGVFNCTWKPPIQRIVNIYSVISQNGLVVARSNTIQISVEKRTGLR